MLLKMPGIMAHGDFQASLARIQKHRGQESGRARRPRFLAEIRMGVFVRPWCIEGKRGFGQKALLTNENVECLAMLFKLCG